MGYRSDVAIGIAFENKAQMTAFLTKVKLQDESGLFDQEIKCYRVCGTDTDVVLLHAYWPCVKWYGGYLDVEFHHAMLAMACEADLPAAYIRVGEEVDDIDREVYDQDWFCISDFFAVRVCIDHPKPDDSAQVGQYIRQESRE